jgi:hypothetical protein
MTNDEIAAVIFNETRSLSGENIFQARVNIAHAILNGESSGKRDKAAPTTAKVPEVEKVVYDNCLSAVSTMRVNAENKIDPTDGATNFNFRKNTWEGDFYGKKIKTHLGPFNNSYPSKDLPATGIYANTYG